MRFWEAKVKLHAILISTIVIWALFACSCTNPNKEPVVNSEQAPEIDIVSRDQDDRPLIVAFGNSLTAGSGVDPSQNYPSKLQAKLDAHGYRYRVLNAGVSGETSSQGRDRAESYSYASPAIAIVELGANDGLRGLPVENTQRNLEAIVSRFQSMGAEVILAGMEMPPNYGPVYTESFRNIFQSIAREYNVALIPFFLDGVGGHPHLNQDDGIHPTGEGYDIIVENVWAILEPLLKKREAEDRSQKSEDRM